MGVGRYLKEQNPDIKVIAVEPPLGERVEGLRNLDEGYIPPVFEQWNGRDLLDRKRVVRPRESIEWTRRLLEQGVFAGLCAGAALAGAVKVAAEIDQGSIVFIVCDGGWKYLSTGAYTADLDAAEQPPRASSTSDPARSIGVFAPRQSRDARTRMGQTSGDGVRRWVDERSRSVQPGPRSDRGVPAVPVAAAAPAADQPDLPPFGTPGEAEPTRVMPPTDPSDAPTTAMPPTGGPYEPGPPFGGGPTGPGGPGGPGGPYSRSTNRSPIRGTASQARSPHSSLVSPRSSSP